MAHDATIKDSTTQNVMIKPGLRADIMRQLIETKDTLTDKGSMYVGTGTSKTVGGVDIYNTKELKITDTPNPGESGHKDKVLMVGGDNQLGYKKITQDNFENFNFTTLNIGTANVSTLTNASSISVNADLNLGSHELTAFEINGVDAIKRFSSSSTIGTPSNPFSTVYGNNFSGLATSAEGIYNDDLGVGYDLGINYFLKVGRYFDLNSKHYIPCRAQTKTYYNPGTDSLDTYARGVSFYFKDGNAIDGNATYWDYIDLNVSNMSFNSSDLFFARKVLNYDDQGNCRLIENVTIVPFLDEDYPSNKSLLIIVKEGMARIRFNDTTQTDHFMPISVNYDDGYVYFYHWNLFGGEDAPGKDQIFSGSIQGGDWGSGTNLMTAHTMKYYNHLHFVFSYRDTSSSTTKYFLSQPITICPKQLISGFSSHTTDWMVMPLNVRTCAGATDDGASVYLDIHYNSTTHAPETLFVQAIRSSYTSWSLEIWGD